MDNPEKRAKAIVQAVTHDNDPQILAEVSTDLGEAMVGTRTSSFVLTTELYGFIIDGVA